MKVALVGVGAWGQNHARVLAYLRGEGLIDHILLMDVDESRAKTVARRFGCEWTTDFERALRGDVDAVIIASPTRLHFTQARKALLANKHVLVEKPMAETYEQARELVELARERRLILMTGFLLRYSPAVEFVKEKYAKNELGKLLLVYAKRTNPWPKRPQDVGVVRDLAIHDIDLVRFLFDAVPVKVFARGGSLRHSYEDYMSAFVDCESRDNFVLVLEANWVTPHKFRRFEVTTERMVVEIDLVRHTVKLHTDKGVRNPAIPYREPLYEEDKNFVRAVLGEEKPRMSGVDGALALLVCECLLRSLSTGTPVEVPREEILRLLSYSL